MSVRLFAAVDLPDDARAAMSGALEALHRELARAGLDRAFRWVAVPNLHLTLRFLGNVDDAAADRVIAAMHEPFDTLRGRLTLGPLGTFPPRGRPRVVHRGVDAGVELLARLRDEMDARLRPLCTWEEERRPFAPHLTLARGRDGAAVDLPRLREILDRAQWPDVAFPVDAVTLFSSRTLPSGPEYTARARAALRSG